MIRYYLASLIISIFLCGCYHNDDTTTIGCGNPGVGLKFIGYAPADVDTFIVRKYKANNNYSTLIDTSLVDISLWKRTVHGDTTEAYTYDFYKQITDGFDWAIFIPAKSRTYRFSELVIEKRTAKCPNFADCICFNIFTSMKLDNQLYLVPEQTNLGFHFVSLKN